MARLLRDVVRSGAATCVGNVLIARFVGRDAADLRTNARTTVGNSSQQSGRFADCSAAGLGNIGSKKRCNSPREKDKLLVAMAAMVARKRLERGVKLNHPEAIALITDFVVEGARDGKSVADPVPMARQSSRRIR